MLELAIKGGKKYYGWLTFLLVLIGVGFLLGGPTTYMSVAVTGQSAAASGSGEFDAAELVCVHGSGVHENAGRSGDYSSTTVDPADGTTFWHTNEYVAVTDQYSWNTTYERFGALVELPAGFRVLGELIDGRTYMGPPFRPVDVGFQAAYTLVEWHRGPWEAGLRLERFETRELGRVVMFAPDSGSLLLGGQRSVFGGGSRSDT